jgi:hypothetical protein
MSDRAHRKERQRLKRQRKKEARQKRDGVSPYLRLARSSQAAQCYAAGDPVVNGIVSVFVLRPAPWGGHAAAGFLVDFWCLGLKDAWGDLRADATDWKERFRNEGPERVRFRTIELSEVRKMVAGGIRFAQMNGFRLPPKFDRWATAIGVERWADADVSGFGKDGGLLYVGALEDLSGRLVRESVEAFLARPGVHFLSPVSPDEEFEFLDEDEEYDDGEEWDEDDGDGVAEEGGAEDEAAPIQMSVVEDERLDVADAVREGTAQLTEKAYEAACRWCAEQGMAPHAKLREGIALMIQAIADAQMEGRGWLSRHEVWERMGQRFADGTDESSHLSGALGQVDQYMAQYASSEEMVGAIGQGAGPSCPPSPQPSP